MKQVKIFFSLLFFAAVLSSCFEDVNEPLIYEGEDMAEFASPSMTLQLLKQPAEDVTGEITVQLLGEQRSSATTVEVQVVEDQTSALEGVHYDFPDGTTVTIPANSSFGTLAVNVYHSGFMVEEAVSLTLQLQGNDDIGVNANKATVALTLKKINVCPLTKEDMVGIWEVTENSFYDGPYDPYLIEIHDAPGDSLLITGHGDQSVGLWNWTLEGQHPDVYALVDLTPGQETFEIIRNTSWMTHSSYGAVTFAEYNPPSTLNTCEKEIYTDYVVQVAAGYFDIIDNCTISYVGPLTKSAETGKSAPAKEKKLVK